MESLAIHYRPQTFEEVCSQKSIIDILKRQLEIKAIRNCYLFAGASGCGKTTVARIFANEINNHQGVPIEIDGASNRGIDNIRQIINSAAERAVDGKYKIYILDECQQLTTEAWSALLKLVEEPPEFTIFIFCTTDPQKIPATILNRVMRFNFTKVDIKQISQRLAYICETEGFTNYSEACDYISKLGQGCVRDSISLLDKAASYSTDLSIENVLVALGGISHKILFDLVDALILQDSASVLSFLEHISNQGIDLKQFIDQFLSFCLDLNKYILFKDLALTNLPSSLEFRILNSTNITNANEYYLYLVNKILACKNDIKFDTNAKSTIEVYFLNICKRQ